MKIYGNTGNMYGVSAYRKTVKANVSSKNIERNPAAVSTDTAYKPSAEGKFVSGASKAISSEIRAEIPRAELDSLREQISGGTYKFSLDDIAKAMLLG